MRTGIYSLLFLVISRLEKGKVLILLSEDQLFIYKLVQKIIES